MLWAVLLVLLASQDGWPQPPGVVVSKDGASVNVTIDPSVVPNLGRMERGEGRMVFEVPEPSRLQIDPVLKSSGLVQVNGKTVTIHSDQVYLGTQDLSGLAAQSAPAPVRPSAATPVARPVTKPATPTSKKPVPSAAAAASAVRPAHSSVRPPVSSLPKPTVSVTRPSVADSVTRPLPVAEPVVLPEVAPAGMTPVEAATQAPDPESLPITYQSEAREQASRTSTDMLWRLVLSLGVVLTLFLVFVKSLLPKLMAQYPEFFENLKARQATTADRQAKSDASKPKAGKKQYLERLGVGSDRFNVITSTRLGRGQELHLVEIRGRHLVIATTPFSVSLIQDLGVSNGSDTGPPEPDGMPEEMPIQVSGLLGTSDLPMASDAAFYRATQAYLADSESQVPPARPGRFATPPEAAAKPAGNPDAERYRKYLSREEREHARQRHQEVSDYLAGHTPPSSTVDAEEVVILEDYDDVYPS